MTRSPCPERVPSPEIAGLISYRGNETPLVWWPLLASVLPLLCVCTLSGSEKGVFWKRGLFRTVHFLEILENLEILEFLEKPQPVEKKGDCDHFLEILENLEILEILEISPVKRPLS